MKFIYSPILHISCCLILLTSCWNVRTTNMYSEDFKFGRSISDPIYLSIKNTEKSTIYLLLDREIGTNDIFIKVRWVYKNKVKQFKGKETSLNFQVDQFEIISLMPAKPARLVSYNLDKSLIEEECVYKISEEDFKKIASAKSVTLMLEGKTENKVAHFNRIHTFKAFRDFLKNS